MGSTWFSSTFVSFLIFRQIKNGRPNFLGGTNYAERLNYLVLPLYFNFRNLKDPNSSSLIRFQWVLNDSPVLFSIFWNFVKVKRGGLISWGKQFRRMAELFALPFYISFSEIWRTQNFRHSLDSNGFHMIQQYFYHFFKISSN